MHKPLSFFKGKTGDLELAQGSYDFFEEGRQKRIEEVKAMRQALIDDGWTAAMATACPSKGNDESGAADLVERERKRLEVLRNRCGYTHLVICIFQDAVHCWEYCGTVW